MEAFLYFAAAGAVISILVRVITLDVLRERDQWEEKKRNITSL